MPRGGGDFPSRSIRVRSAGFANRNFLLRRDSFLKSRSLSSGDTRVSGGAVQFGAAETFCSGEVVAVMAHSFLRQPDHANY